ncbi:MAG: isochorismatase family protein [Bacteroidota bacterium]
MRSSKALLIIDMQKGSFTAKTPRFDAKGTVFRINELSSTFRALKLPVIFIQHDGTGNGEFEKNAPDWENLDEPITKSEDVLIDKYANDSFYRSALESKLIEMDTRELFVTGCATDFCVESTIQSAITKDFKVTVVSDAHTTGDRPKLKAEQVIEHYNWVWQHMIRVGGSVSVLSSEQVKEMLNSSAL